MTSSQKGLNKSMTILKATDERRKILYHSTKKHTDLMQTLTEHYEEQVKRKSNGAN